MRTSPKRTGPGLAWNFAAELENRFGLRRAYRAGHPFLLVRIILPDDASRITVENGIRRRAPGDYGVRGDHTVAPEDQLALGTDDRGTVGNEGSLSDADPSALGKTLIADRSVNVLVGVVLIDNQNILGNENIALDMDEVLRPDLRTPVNDAVVFDDDDRMAPLLGWQAETEARIFFHPDITAQLDAVRVHPVNFASKVERHLGADGRKRIGEAQPLGIKLPQRARRKL